MASAAKPALADHASPLPKPANPAPLGLAAFGVTTVVLSAINSGLLPPEATAAVVPLAFGFGGLTQLIVGVLEFKNGNTFGTVCFLRRSIQCGSGTRGCAAGQAVHEMKVGPARRPMRASGLD